MKILIATNHSYMFYRFRKELVEALMQEHEVILSTPFVGHEDDLQAMGLRCIETDIDRRSINPFKDMKLLKTYRQMLDELQPDMVVTYSIKPNIYRLYVNSWGRSKTKKARRVGAKAPARFYVWQKRILFLKLRKLRIPKQTRFKTFVLLLQPSINPFDQGTSMELRISLNQL